MSIPMNPIIFEPTTTKRRATSQTRKSTATRSSSGRRTQQEQPLANTTSDTRTKCYGCNGRGIVPRTKKFWASCSECHGRRYAQ